MQFLFLTPLLTPSVAAEPRWFHPGTGDQVVEIAADGTINGVPVEETGVVLVGGASEADVLGLDGVASALPIAHGRALRVVPEPGIDPVALSRLLRDLPGARWAHPDVKMPMQTHALPNDPLLGEQWHLLNTGQRNYTPGVDINAEEAWDITTGAGMLVAVIDSGVDIDHPDLDVVDGPDVVDMDDSSDPLGDDAHGTAVAGLAVGLGDNGLGTSGVAYDGTAYGIRLIGGSSGGTEDVLIAFTDAVDAGAVVLNNSWGYDVNCGPIPLYGSLEEALDYAWQEGRNGLGTPIVFSAGNDACDIENDEMQQHPGVISVAAINGRDRREGYSSFGVGIDIAAPSGNIATTDIEGPRGYGDIDGDDDYTGTFSGTSASAPIVSGVVALMISANPRLTAKNVETALCDTAVRVNVDDGNWDDSGWNPFYGCGRIDAGAAVRAVVNAGGPGVPLPTSETEAEPGSLRLTWSAPVDPDGDHLTYRVKYWTLDRPNVVERLDSDREWTDLDYEFIDGQTVVWQVRASDLWGNGEWSEEHSVVISAPPPEPVEEPAACSHGPRDLGIGWWIGLPLIWIRRNRRRDRA